MNSFERVSTAIKGGEPDHPPVFDLLRNDEGIRYYANEDLTGFNREAVVHKAIGNCLDATKQFIRYPERVRTEELEDGRKVIYDRWTRWVAPMIFGDVNQAAEYLKEVINSPEKFMGDPVGYVRKAEEDYARKQSAIGDIALFLEMDTTEGFHEFYELLGLETFSYLTVDYPELVGEYLDLCVQRSLRRIESLTIAERLPGVFYATDLAGKSGPIFSPGFLRRQVFPRMEMVMEAYHRKGIPVLYHSDGNLFPILDDLVAIGIDGLNPIEVLAGMNLGEIRRRYPALMLAGGIDCSQLLPFASCAEVKKEVRKAIESAGPGYCVGSSTELHNAIPLRNIRAMIETAEEYRY